MSLRRTVAEETGKDTVLEAVAAAGFRMREAVKSLRLKTNYYLILERL